MLITKKMLIALVLVGALVGGGIGSLVTHSTASSAATETTSTPTQTATTDKTADQTVAQNSADLGTPQEQAAYRQGYDDGFAAAENARTGSSSRTVYRSSSYRAPARRASSRTAYYDYSQPKGRTFWQKHRDKLTLAIGTGAGAAIGGLIGGKKGAGIGALSGLGGSALYTYKLRKRSPRY